MVDHKAITDAERHEAKGASTATAGYVLSAKGDTTTQFVDPKTLTNINTTVILEQGSTSTQAPAAVDTVLQLEFGPAASTTDITLSTAGLITLLKAGYYKFTVDYNFSRTSGTGNAIIVVRSLINSTPYGQSKAISLLDGVLNFPYQEHFEGYFAANTTFTCEMLRDSTGINNGSLSPIDPVLTGWATVPSAWIRVHKVLGAS